MRNLVRVLGLLGALGVSGILAQDPPPACVAECANTAKNSFATFSCDSASNAECLCGNADFKFSVRDCAQNTCGASEDQVTSFFDTDAFCQGVASPDDNEPSSTTAAPEETASPEPAPTEAPAETTPGATPTPITPILTPTLSSSTSEAAATSTGTDTDDSEDDDDDDEGAAAGGGGLSSGAAVGIGVGVAVVVVAIAVVGVVLWLRNRKQGPNAQSVDIAGPMPGAGATGGRYGSADNAAYEKRPTGDSIELTTNRYEDMVPRAVPRNMV